MTLQCRSEVRSDTFPLSKEGSPAPPQHLRMQDAAPPVRANFTLRAVTAAHSGTSRCYSSQSAAPHLLSLPSDPLELLVSGEGQPRSCVLRGRPGPCPQGSSGLRGSGGSQRGGSTLRGPQGARGLPSLPVLALIPGGPDPLPVMEQSWRGLGADQQDSRPAPLGPTLLSSPVLMAPRPEGAQESG